jgi:hypothetical protein
MTVGLPTSRLIIVGVNLAAQVAQAPNLNSLCIVGDSDVIDTQTRIMSFGSLTDVAALFGTSAPEYLAAALYFSQVPSPTQLYIGRWAQAATNGRNFGGALSAAQKVLTNFTAVVSGGFKIVVDGAAAVNVAAINLSAVTNLNGVATAINTALSGAAVAATCSWDGTRFTFKSNSTGAASAIGYLQPPTSGIDLGLLLLGTAATGARLVSGIVAETIVQAVNILDSQPTSFYGLTVASTHFVDPANNTDILAVAAYIEGVAPNHLFGVSCAAPGCIDSTSTTDIAYLLHAANYSQTFATYNSAGAYTAASIFGRFLTTNFAANNSMITLMFKNEPGVTAESLTTQQADALKTKCCNVFTAYDNGTAIIEYGTVAGGLYIDEVYGVSWQKFRIQTDLFNALVTNATKIPQTDAGMAQLATVIEGSLAAGVNNGLIGPGTWTNGGFGQLKTGDYLSNGFYVYTPPLSQQSVSDRAARKSVAYQVAAKLAGAVHEVDLVLNINR